MIKWIDVYKAFGEKKVLDGFTLDVREGEAVVIIGFSGAGKSVAIKHVVGLLEPDRGTVEVDDKDVATLLGKDMYELRARIGFLLQFAALVDAVTIAEKVTMALGKRGHPSE